MHQLFESYASSHSDVALYDILLSELNSTKYVITDSICYGNNDSH